MHNNLSSQQRSAESVEGEIQKIIFPAQLDTGYMVFRLRSDASHMDVTIAGYFPGKSPAMHERWHILGAWGSHPKYGEQFRASSGYLARPTTLVEIERYLASGPVEGIGPSLAARIVQRFGVDTITIIEKEPGRLREVPGIGKQKTEQIARSWNDQKAIHEIFLFLQGHGIPPGLSIKIYKRYGDQAIHMVSENPYQLANEIFGVGFLTADAVARKLGMPPNGNERILAGISYALASAGQAGHCYLPHGVLVDHTIKLLSLPDVPESLISPEQVEQIVSLMVRLKRLTVERGEDGGDSRYFLANYHHTETELAQRMRFLLSVPAADAQEFSQAAMDEHFAGQDITLSALQRQAVELALTQRLLILTGGPGTGKTTTTRTIVRLWKRQGKNVVLLAPTGRAAQRLAEVTGYPASTIHKHLKLLPQEQDAIWDAEPIIADAVVIDETSMVDVFLAHALFHAIPAGTRILLVGDSDQLPSVGPGNVLRDSIASGVIPTVHLTEVFRQAAESDIITNAHLINHGQFPQLTPMVAHATSDCLWIDGDMPARAAEAVKHLLLKTLPKKGIDVLNDVQVLCPGKKGEVGTHALNAVIQSTLNPPQWDKAEIQRGERIFRVGDRVIQLKNNYELRIWNGDIGIIQGIDREHHLLLIRFSEQTVEYAFDDLAELALAWAITIHKSQGSEYPHVIIPIFTQHYILLNRSLLYTALTRAKQSCVLIGSTQAIAMTVHKAQDRSRYTWLAQRLRNG